MHVSVDLTQQQSFAYLVLSYRGSELQAPSLISLSLGFGAVISAQEASNAVPAGWTVSRRLDHVLEALHGHGHAGCLSKWNLDDVKRHAVPNFLCGIQFY
eukprot:s1219_g5.t1